MKYYRCSTCGTKIEFPADYNVGAFGACCPLSACGNNLMDEFDITEPLVVYIPVGKALVPVENSSTHANGCKDCHLFKQSNEDCGKVFPCVGHSREDKKFVHFKLVTDYNDYDEDEEEEEEK